MHILTTITASAGANLCPSQSIEHPSTIRNRGRSHTAFMRAADNAHYLAPLSVSGGTISTQPGNDAEHNSKAVSQ